MSSPRSIDEYLDDLSERLTGSGENTRRFLIEAESHLRDECDALVERGAEPLDE